MTFVRFRRLLPLGALELLGFALARAARRAPKSMTPMFKLVVPELATLRERHAVPLRFARNASMSCGVNRMERRSLPAAHVDVRKLAVVHEFAQGPRAHAEPGGRLLDGEPTLRVALARSPSRTQADVPARLGIEGRHAPAAPPLEVGRDDPLAAAAQLDDVRLDVSISRSRPSGRTHSRNAISARSVSVRRARCLSGGVGASSAANERCTR